MAVVVDASVAIAWCVLDRPGVPDAEDAISTLARKHGLSGYDAAYLETAIRRRAKLSTLDKKLAGAAASEGVS